MFHFIKNKKIVDRLNERIEILTNHWEIYKKYHSMSDAHKTEEILKVLNYIKNGKEN